MLPMSCRALVRPEARLREKKKSASSEPGPSGTDEEDARDDQEAMDDLEQPEPREKLQLDLGAKDLALGLDEGPEDHGKDHEKDSEEDGGRDSLNDADDDRGDVVDEGQESDGLGQARDVGEGSCASEK